MTISRRMGLGVGLGALAAIGLPQAQAEAVTLAITQMPWRGNDAWRIVAEVASALGPQRPAPVVVLLPPAYGAVDETVPADLARTLGVHLGGAMNGAGFLFSPEGARLLRGDGTVATPFAAIGLAHAGNIEGAEILLNPSFDVAQARTLRAPCVAATAPDALDLGEIAADLTRGASVTDCTGACTRSAQRTLVTTIDLGAMRRGHYL